MSDGERWKLQTQSHGASRDAPTTGTRSEYRMLKIDVGSSSGSERVGSVDVSRSPAVDEVMETMARDGWDVHAFTIDGNAAILIFRRPAPVA